MYIPFCNLNDLFFYQSARHPIYIFNFIYYFPVVFIISSMFLVLVFICLGVLFCFFFAQALCEVKEMLTPTWYFPTCSPLPFLSSTHFVGLLFFFLPPTVWDFLGWDAAGGRRGWLFSICSFCANARSSASQLKTLHLLVALKKKTNEKKTKKTKK